MGRGELSMGAILDPPMLARLARLALALEITFYAAIIAWLHAWQGWDVAALIVASAVLGLGARFCLVCFTCLVGWLNGLPRAPAHAIGLAGGLRLVLGEYRALLADNLLFLPFESLAVRPDRRVAPGMGAPIILVHGYLGNRGFFRPLVRGLEARGVAGILTPNFRSVFATIERFASELHLEIERVSAAAGGGQVVLVCHSMGGLAARQYIVDQGAARIAKLITIASPHHGTALARLGLGANARQMRRDSEFLGALAAGERAHPPRFPAISIYSPHDNLVSPQETSRLSWARNVALPGFGHIHILASRELLGVLLEELR